MDTMPMHLRPESCYVCGGSKHSDRTAQGGHKFWSNADASREFSQESATAYSKEAAYVAQHRPY